MKRIKLSVIFILGLILFFSGKSQALTNNYEAYPPFLQASTYSNLMLVLDYSGSMSEEVYNSGNCDSSQTYKGFFKQDENYSCSNWDDDSCTGYWYIDNGGSYSGNILNCNYMTRIDILRWVFTGGKVERIRSNNVISTYYTKIKNTDTTTYNPDTGENEGILQKLAREDKRPRIGALIYGGTDVSKVWIYPTYDYNTIINAINGTSTDGGTPTGEAMDEILRYFKRESGVWSNNANFYNSYQDPYKFDVNGTVMDVACAKNYALLMTDGAWNGHAYADYSDNLSCSPNSTLVQNPPDAGSYNYSCAIDPAEPAYNMWQGGNADLVESLTGKQNVQTYAVSAFLSGIGVNAVKHVAIYGGFDDKDGDSTPCNYNSYSDTHVPDPPCGDVKQTGSCGSFVAVENRCDEWDKNIDGVPDNFFEGNSPGEIKAAIENVFQNILKDLSSGTSVAVLTDKRKEGSIMTQAVFYPDYQGVPWIGKLFGYWFLNFRDPQGNSVQNIREDTDGDFMLDICDNGSVGGDHILQFGYDDINNELSIAHYKSDCSGYIDNSSFPDYYAKLEDINSLFEASNKIDSDYSPNFYEERKIYTTCDNSSNCIDEQNLTVLDNYTTASDFGSDYGCLGSFDNLTDFVYGESIPGCVNRTDDDGIKRILGDIIYSTPQIANYDNMSMIYVAANDGMLHAFRAGKTMTYQSSDYIAVQLQNAKNDNNTNEIGKEEWAFIPKKCSALS